jgi:hypothetical protein
LSRAAGDSAEHNAIQRELRLREEASERNPAQDPVLFQGSEWAQTFKSISEQVSAAS